MSTTYTGYLAFGNRIHTNDPAEIERWREFTSESSNGYWDSWIEIVFPAGPAAPNGEVIAIVKLSKVEVWNSNSYEGPDSLYLSTGRGTGGSILNDFLAAAAEAGLDGGWFDEMEYPDYVYWLEVR